MRKIILTEIRRGAALHPSLNRFIWALFSSYTEVRMLLTFGFPGCCHRMLPNWIELFQSPPPNFENFESTLYSASGSMLQLWWQRVTRTKPVIVNLRIYEQVCPTPWRVSCNATCPAASFSLTVTLLWENSTVASTDPPVSANGTRKRRKMGGSVQ